MRKPFQCGQWLYHTASGVIGKVLEQELLDGEYYLSIDGLDFQPPARQFRQALPEEINLRKGIQPDVAQSVSGVGSATTTNPIGSTMLSNPTTSMLVRAGKHGAKQAASLQAAELITDTIRNVAGDAYPAFFQTQLGSMIEQPLVIAGLHAVVTNFGGQIPKADAIAAACEYAMQGDVANKIGPILQALTPAFDKIAEAAPDAEVHDLAANG